MCDANIDVDQLQQNKAEPTPHLLVHSANPQESLSSNLRLAGISQAEPSSSHLRRISQAASASIQTDQQTSTCELWKEAYNKLPDEYKEDLDNLNNLQVLQKLLETASEAQNKCAERQWSIPWGGKQINVREKAEKLLAWITKFRAIGDIAMQYDPVHAALPWAGVRFILTVCSPNYPISRVEICCFANGIPKSWSLENRNY